jgi:hypothetical protein
MLLSRNGQLHPEASAREEQTNRCTRPRVAAAVKGSASGGGKGSGGAGGKDSGGAPPKRAEQHWQSTGGRRGNDPSK